MLEARKLELIGFAVEHDPRSVEIYRFIADMDFKNGDDFCFKSGGDGDNGEMILAYLDEYFRQKDISSKEMNE